jgi:hypothetical protein
MADEEPGPSGRRSKGESTRTLLSNSSSSCTTTSVLEISSCPFPPEEWDIKHETCFAGYKQTDEETGLSAAVLVQVKNRPTTKEILEHT